MIAVRESYRARVHRGPDIASRRDPIAIPPFPDPDSPLWAPWQDRTYVTHYHRLPASPVVVAARPKNPLAKARTRRP